MFNILQSWSWSVPAICRNILMMLKCRTTQTEIDVMEISQGEEWRGHHINSFSCQEVCNMNLKTGYFIGKQDWWKPSFSHLQSQQHQHQHNSNSSLEGFSVDIAELINCGAINKRGGSTYWKYYYLLYWLTDSLQDNGLFYKVTSHNVKDDIVNDHNFLFRPCPLMPYLAREVLNIFCCDSVWGVMLE